MTATNTPPRIAALVPMRHSSERVPNKNFRPFHGKPLYHWIVAALLDAPSVGEVVIDTDSPTIRDDAAKHFPGVRVIERPEHLRDGSIPMNEVLLNTVKQIDADYYLQTHSTNPLLRAETIERAVRAFHEALPAKDSLFGVTRWQTRFYDADGKAMNHDPSVLLRTQDLPPVYEENSNVYIFSRQTLEERGNRIGHRPVLFEIDRLESTDIDDEEAFRLAEAIAQTGLVQGERA
ncbi:MAG: cytidylyltransferase domain-containing protein [Phycisphaerales bacterium JB058]